jgi:hypothetical protein
MNRRTLLQMLAAAGAWAKVQVGLGAQAASLDAADERQLRAIAEVVLPTELGDAGRRAVVDDFTRWARGYREGAEMDHGYGFTRLRQTPASPVGKYPAQLAALDRAARAKGASFDTLDLAGRRQIVEAALASAKIDRLPPRPAGEHVAVDLMAFYFNSGKANDLAYGVAIGRDHCRGLPGSSDRPDRGQTPV